VTVRSGGEVAAAGGVVWRRDGDDIEILLVHRPRYDDWSLPKGKLDAGESFEEAAVREVAEETGYEVALGAELASTHYHDRYGRPKIVRYWAMTVTGGEFVPNHEVDAARWVTPDRASTLLTYDRDADVIASFTANASPA
jgi:8-oxo-dGTP diphosphatase